MESVGRQLHGQAEQAREGGDFTKALELTDQAMVAYQKDGDSLGFAEVLASRFLTLRHLFESTGDRKYLILAKHSALSSVEIAQASNDKTALAIPLFNLAKSQETLGEIKEAVESYKQAVDNLVNNPPAVHKTEDRPAILADFQIHLSTCEYKNGDKSALERAEKALGELEQNPDISDYNQHVWVSGGHMRIAEVLMSDDPGKAKEHLQKAKGIIDGDPRLKLRLEQWQKLSQQFS